MKIEANFYDFREVYISVKSVHFICFVEAMGSGSACYPFPVRITPEIVSTDLGHEGKATLHFISHQAKRTTWFIWPSLWQWDSGSAGTNP